MSRMEGIRAKMEIETMQLTKDGTTVWLSGKIYYRPGNDSDSSELQIEGKMCCPTKDLPDDTSTGDMIEIQHDGRYWKLRQD